MTNDIDTDCRKRGWAFAAAVGVVIAVLLMWGADFGWFWALLLGLIAVVACGFAFTRLFCESSHRPVASHAQAAKPAPTAATTPPPAPTATTTPVTPVASSRVPPDEPAAAPDSADAIPPADAAPADAIPPDAERKAAAPRNAPPAAPAPVEMPGDADTTPRKPETLSAPRDGSGDNLKRIKGVGPKLAAMLNRMGFYHFDQIAAWSDAEIAWVDENLEGFKGRVMRDDWVSQARILAGGDETEFSGRTKGAK